MHTSRNRIALLLLSGFVSNIGDWLSIVALMVICYQKTGSAFGVSMILVVRALPTLLFGFYGGHLADHYSKKFIMVTCNLLRALGVACLAFNQSIPIVYLVSFILAGLGAFFTPAMDASVPNLVSKDQLVRANGWLGVSQMLAMIIGPALATICLEMLGVQWTFLLDALSFLVFGLALLAIPREGTATATPPLPIAQSLKEGIHIVLSSYKAISVLGIHLCAYIAMGALATLELVFCARILKVNPQAYGQVIAVAGAGAMIASFYAGKLSLRHMGIINFAGVLIFGIGIALFSTQTMLLATFPFLVMEGIGESFFTIGGKTMLQEMTPENKLARIMSFRNIAEKVGMLFGMLVSGVLAELFAVDSILLSSGIVLSALSLFLLPVALPHTHFRLNKS